MRFMQPDLTDGTTGILFTDQYQLTMAQLYFDQGLHTRRARFEMFFREYPDYGEHQAGYCIAAGLEPLLEWMEGLRFTEDDLAALAAQRTGGGEQRFRHEFLEWLRHAGDMTAIHVDAVAEGRVVHPHVPMVVVDGPLALAQMLETALVNHISYPTLVATKASRVQEAGRGRPVLEFGLRRGPGWGANAGARAALVGGCDFTSNVGVSQALGLDPKGTHAHSMVQVFMAVGGGEREAFRAYAASYPDECMLLVDTIDTLGSGVPNAISVFEELRAAGHDPRGIRLDSGDLAFLAVQSARMLDEAGFPQVQIVLSSNLDELAMWQILSQIEVEAPRYGVSPESVVRRLAYGVGTRLITSHGDSALGGVYKLVAVADGTGYLQPAIKVSDSPEKVPVPGVKQVWRVYDRRGIATADVIGVAGESPFDGEVRLAHPHRTGVGRVLHGDEVSLVEELLEPAFRDGRRTRPAPILEDMRRRRQVDLERLDPGVRRLVNPHIYHVSLTEQMRDLREHLVAAAAG
jgi:nicotinate phosphoribosyltransferase